MMVDFNGLARSVRDDLRRRLPDQRKTQRDKLSVLVATMLEVRSGSVMELAHGLPLETTDRLSRFQWIKRFLQNPLVDADAIMASYARELLQKACEGGQQPVLIIDQSTITSKHRHELIMVALRIGKRALPICWRSYKASGSLGWKEQSEVLALALPLLPEGVVPVLMGDRFYGHSDIITWCLNHDWDYCLRLKGSLRVAIKPDTPASEDRSLSDLFRCGQHRLANVYLTRNRIQTNIQMLFEPGHKEPWIIASSRPPSIAMARRYAKRWGIEAMFSDFKTRGFGIHESQLRINERINRLILIMAIAFYWAVSVGLWKNYSTPKKTPTPEQCFPCSKLVSDIFRS